MDKELKKWLAVMSIAIAALVILLLLLSGYDLSVMKIHKGVKFN